MRNGVISGYLGFSENVYIAFCGDSLSGKYDCACTLFGGATTHDVPKAGVYALYAFDGPFNYPVPAQHFLSALINKK